MGKFRSRIRQATFGFAAIALLLFSPVVAFAETPSNTNTAPPTTKTDSPQGADADAYHLNEKTGLWESEHFTWNPVTHETKPKTPPSYTYNPTTKTWDTTEWRYDPAAGKYVAQTVSTPDKPAGAPNAPTSSTTSEPNTSKTTAKPQGDPTISSNTTNNVKETATSSQTVNNNIDSSAQSGDAKVAQNTKAGNATTGNASAAANVMNMLQSSWLPQGGKIATFSTDINGDVVGDLLINPSNYTGNLNVSTSKNNNLDIHVADSKTINNNINLDAKSGNASVTGNTQAGNATSGAATAMANVINMVNSMISSGQSFVGTININGNLTGDILLPKDLHEQLLASNAPKVTIDISKMENNHILSNFNNDQTINNSVDLAAKSGNASVQNNTSAGNATTGNASTNLTVFNLTGHDVVGSNAMLVFVNVLGEWVGMLMDAPAGTTAAMIGGDVTSNSTVNNNLAADISSKTQINNNITANATSGDATVDGNTSAGNATSGDAKAGANIANITNSDLSFSNWFGVLFINVFGSWHGSFGVDTPMGNQPPILGVSDSSTTPAPSGNGVKVFQFIPNSSGKPHVHALTTGGTGAENITLASNNENSQNQPQVLGATTHNSGKPGNSNQAKRTSNHFNGWLIGVTILLALAFWGAERLLVYISVRRQRATA